MKYLKMLGLMALAAAALMAFAGSASATVLTGTGCAAEGCAAGTVISSELSEGEAVLKSSFIGEVKCKESTVSGTTSNKGSSTETVSGAISTLTFTNCNAKVEVLKKGTLEVHATSGGNGTLTSSGAEVTTELSGIHCIFTTSNTNLGTVTGGSPATFAAKSAAIPRTGGRSGGFCGSSASWIASYKVVSPSTLSID